MSETPPDPVVYLVWASSDEVPAMVYAARPAPALALDAQQEEFRRLSDGKQPISVKDLTGTAYAGVGDHTRHVPHGQVLVDHAVTPTVVAWIEEWPIR